MYYLYDSKTSQITSKQEEAPATEVGNYGILQQDLDLTYYDYAIGAIDDKKNITWLNPPMAKPANILIQRIQELQSQNDVLGQTAAQLQIDNMQMNTTVDTLGATVAQLQLANIASKGGNA